MLEINISKDSERFLKKLLPKHAKQIARKISGLAEYPHPVDSQELRGYEDYRRADTGEYRIIYCVSPRTLFIILIGKRNDDEVYRRFMRKAS